MDTFSVSVDVHVLAESQGIRPVDDFDALLGGWPEDESVDAPNDHQEVTS